MLRTEETEKIIISIASRREASDSITDSSVLSNPTDAQNVYCLGLCGRDICPKSTACPGTFNPELLVSIKLVTFFMKNDLKKC